MEGNWLIIMATFGLNSYIAYIALALKPNIVIIDL